MTGELKLPLPLPKSIETLLEPPFAAPKSRSPSPSKSPVHTENGLSPQGKLVAEANVPSP
ncbi:hypothetical protein ES703_110434 [subsurface metagenome]